MSENQRIRVVKGKFCLRISTDINFYVVRVYKIRMFTMMTINCVLDEHAETFLN